MILDEDWGNKYWIWGFRLKC